MVSSEQLPDILVHPRPPTPPKEHAPSVDDDLGDIIDSLTDSYQVDRVTGPSVVPKTVDPLQRTPPSSADHTTRSGRRTKRVDFSPWSRFHRHKQGSHKTPDSVAPIRHLPPSRTLSATKSILKATSLPSPSESPATPQTRLCSTNQYDTFPEMLDAVLHALSADERDVRLDAYFTLLRTLGAHKDVPEAETLRPKAAQLAQYILRDTSAVNSTTNAPDSQLTGEACKLLSVLMRIPGVTDALGDDTCNTILKKCIVSIEDINASKAIVRHHLFLLAEQRFSTRVMTVERLGRILDVLHTIDERYPGNSVVAMRLLIFKRLADQHPDYMALRITAWLQHIFHGMLSSLDEVRIRAVDAGTSIALATGTNTDTSKALITLFKQEQEDGTTYGDYVAGRLLSMLNFKSKAGEKIDTKKMQQARHVPQIWAVAILFFRARSDRMTTWSHFKLWLNIISQCFNSSDIQTKFHASVAWNRLVYVLMPSGSTEQKLYVMLKQPMSAQLGTKGVDKFAVAIRKYALGSYCNLLHYAFRPNATFQDWSRAWEEYVPPLIELLRKRSDFNTALLVIQSLMESEASNLWNENRANESPFVLELQDLPRLEPHWIRQNVEHILRLIGPLLHVSPEKGAEDKDSPAMQSWDAVLHAIAEAGNKEITASKELKLAMAKLLDFWFNSWPTEAETFGVSEVARQLAFGTSIVEIIGPERFGEVVLKRRMTGQPGTTTFEVVSNPSIHRDRGSVDSALGHVVRFLCATRDSETEALCAPTARHLVTLCTTARNGSDQEFQALIACVSEFTSRVQAADKEGGWDETDDEAELPKAPPILSRSPLLRNVSATPSPLRSAQRSKALLLAPPAQASRKTTPRKLRHEDSQIQFAPIHSSPPDSDAAAESQHLTDHQQEVRERQHEAAAGIFSDLSATSPARVLQGPSVNANRLPTRPSSASRMQDKLRSSAAEDNEEPERPSTPPLPVPEFGMSDDLPPSSPVQSASERRTHANQRSDSFPKEQARRNSPAIAASFLDLPSSSPPRYDHEDVHSNTRNRNQAIEEASTGRMDCSTVAVEDAVLDTATEIADEIIERTKTSAQDEVLTETADVGGQDEETAASQLYEADDGNAAMSESIPSSPNTGKDDAGSNKEDDTAAAEQPERRSAPAEDSESENKQPSVEQWSFNASRVPKTSSPPRNTHQSNDAKAGEAEIAPETAATSHNATKQPVTPGPVIPNSSVAPTLPESASQPSPRSASLGISESAFSDRSSGSQQGVKRKIGRPRKFAKLQHSDSIASTISQSGSPSSQTYQKWKFYSNDGSDIEDHILVRTPEAKHPRKRSSKRSSKPLSPSQIKAVASRVFDDGQDGPSAGRPLTRSLSGMSDSSSAGSPTPKKRRAAALSNDRRSSRLSQLSSAAADAVTEKGDLRDATSLGRVAASVQVVQTPANAQTESLQELRNDSKEDAEPVITSPQEDMPSRKRKREPPVGGPASPPACHPAQDSVLDEGIHTPVQPKVRPDNETPNSSMRSILSPAGLLRGLRGILEGCRNAVMGSQEEREVDDMLFEIRREVHEAGRRAKRLKVE